ncbi:hypothetical protein C8D97_109125 [Pleionea mediterranea]|uniref:Uncharacterized protein n=2 Tax=Pleionea mediterranea TaxID=523701 RepID=A0A316FIK6_9GAMM|nr:hypothetical protein C8D97_109125 [Pleionea mediterranea]
MDLDKEFVITELTISNSSSKREQKVWELVKKAGLPNFVNDNKGPRLFMGILESEGRKFGAWLIYGSLETRPVCERAMLNDSVGQCAIDLSGPWYYSVDWHENNK